MGNKKDELTESQKENFGYLRPNDDVINAWESTKKIVDAVEAEVYVIQTPGSFECTEENEENMRELFSKILSEDISIAWEPRGDWKENPEKVKEICDDLEIIHVVDLMRREPLSNHDISYIRLHGLNEKQYDYDYDYSEEELHTLADKLKSLSKSHDKVYCMFNNYEMYNNAGRLRNILEME